MTVLTHELPLLSGCLQKGLCPPRSRGRIILSSECCAWSLLDFFVCSGTSSSDSLPVHLQDRSPIIQTVVRRFHRWVADRYGLITRDAASIWGHARGIL